MKPNQLATLVLRLMGVYCLIQVVPILSLFFGTTMAYLHNAENQNQLRVFIATLLPGVSYLVSGILLLVFSGAWGRKLTQDLDGESITAIPTEEFQVLAFAVAGVLIFVDGLPQLVNSLEYLFGWLTTGNDTPRNRSAYDAHDVLAAIGVLVKAGLGLALFFRAHGIARFWRSLRSFGTPKPPQE